MTLFRLCLGLFATALYGHAAPVVVATNTILADVARQIGGDKIAVQCLLPPDIDPHSYEPKASDVRLIARAHLVVQNGLGLEIWAKRLIEQSGFRGQVVEVGRNLPHPVRLKIDAHEGSAHAHDHEDHDHKGSEIDPHAWHDIRNVSHFAAVIADALARAFPESAETFTTNLRAYHNELAQQHAYAKQQVGSLPPEKRKLVTSHDSLAYLAAAYGLDIIPIAGSSPGAEPSARELAALIRLMQKEGVRAVFLESSSNPKLARMVAQESGARVINSLYTDSLGSAGSGADTFVGMFRHNIDTLVEALR